MRRGLTPLLAGSACCALVASAGAQVVEQVFAANPFEREMSVGLVLDQEQTEAELLAGSAICQVFTPKSDRLERLDIVTKNRTDLSSGIIRLWKWSGSLADTTQGQPLWEDALDFGGADQPRLRSYFPRVDLAPGAQYLIECSRPSEAFYMAGVQRDVYPDGFALTNGTERHDWDLWFRTFGSGPRETLTPRALPPVPDKSPTPPRAPAPVTRDVYLQTVRDFVARTWQGWENEHGPRAADLMYYTGFLYRQDNETQWLDHVAQWLADAEKHLGAKPDSGGTPWYVEHMGWGIRWYRGSPRWTPDVEQTARRVMLIATGKLAESLERGAMNRTVWDVQLTRLASDLYPDAPDAPAWRAFSDEAWHDWADFDDTEEDSSHYNAVFLHFMLGHALQTDQLSLFRRPGMKRWMDRYRDLIAPNGMMVGWGDSVGCGADWGGWVAAFEAAAAQTGDGTYKWAAHQLLDGHRRSIVSDEPLQQGYEDMHSLTLAYMLADHTVQPVTPSAKSEVLTTTYPRYNPPQARRDQKLPYFSLERRQTPWKLVMRDSPGDQACYALFGLLPYGGHGHADAPALLSLFANETLLLNDTSYFHRDWSDHNLLYGVRLSGGALGAAPTETEVKAFKATDALCYADVAWRDYAGYGLAFRREILFVKGLGWWIRDRTEATDPCEWLLGPLWHVDRILSRGDTWFDVDCPVPMSFAWPMANGTDHLLVYFTPQTEAVVDYADMRHRVDEKRPWYSSAPWAPYQCGGPLRLAAGRQAHFSTLLLPLRADESAEAAATNVQTILDEPAATVLRVQRGGTAWRMALNNDGRRLDLGAVATTARAVVVRATQGQKPSVEAVDR